MVRSDCGHVSGRPSGEAVQSWVRIIAPVFPPPARKSSLWFDIANGIPSSIRRELPKSTLPHALEEQHRRCRSGVQRFDAALHRNRHAPGRLGKKRRGQARAFVTDRHGEAPAKRRFVEQRPTGRHRGDHFATRGAMLARPPWKIDILVDVDAEVRALPRAQHLRRPRERTVLRQQNVRSARGRRGAQHRPDVAGVLHAVDEQTKIGPCRRRRRRRVDHREHADPCRQRRDLVEQRVGNDERAIRMAIRQRSHGGTRQSCIGDDQRARGAGALRIDVRRCARLRARTGPSSVGRARTRQGAPLRAAADCSAM